LWDRAPPNPKGKKMKKNSFHYKGFTVLWSDERSEHDRLFDGLQKSGEWAIIKDDDPENWLGSFRTKRVAVEVLKAILKERN
jgi:hypothetical protein